MVECENCLLNYVCSKEQSIYNNCIKSIMRGNPGQVSYNGKRYNVMDVAEDNDCEGCWFKDNYPYFGTKCPYPAVLLCDDNRILIEAEEPIW